MSERPEPGEGKITFNKRYWEKEIRRAKIETLPQDIQDHIAELEAERDRYKSIAERNHLAARTDKLTQLPNRLALEEWVEPVIESCLQARSEGIPSTPENSLFVAMIDLDHFKLINDGPGHPIGDQVLVWFADQMRSQIREGDMVARVGGEEFVIVLNGIDRETAQTLMESLRAGIEGDSKDNLAEWNITDREAITASIGLAEFDQSCLTYNDVFGRADSAMYASKRERNQVSTYDKSDEFMTKKVRDAARITETAPEAA